MELNPECIKQLKGDAVLVKELRPPEMRRGFYVPAVAADNMRKARKRSWRAEVVRFGDKVDFEAFGAVRPGEGEVVIVSPEAKDCPGFTHGEETYLIVRDEDLLAREVAE